MLKAKEILGVVDQESTVYKGQKEYDASFIWGQLVGWFKQTVDKPNASLSADRRGTLSVQDLESLVFESSEKLMLKKKRERKISIKRGQKLK